MRGVSSRLSRKTSLGPVFFSFAVVVVVVVVGFMAQDM